MEDAAGLEVSCAYRASGLRVGVSVKVREYVKLVPSSPSVGGNRLSRRFCGGGFARFLRVCLYPLDGSLMGANAES